MRSVVDDCVTPPLPWAGDPDRTCRHCGLEEPDEESLSQNHAPGSRAGQDEGICAAMDRSRQQVLDAVQRVLDRRVEVATAELQDRPTRAAVRRLAADEATLRRYVAQARAVWPDPTWLPGALAHLGHTS